MTWLGRQRERLLYFALVPAVVIAVLVLGGYALRTALEIEKARRQTVFDATLTLADERVDRLDKLIVAQDNVAIAHVDLSDLNAISPSWLATAARETPTVVAILVLDMEHVSHDVLAFASRVPGPESDLFRRLLVARLIPEMNLGGDVTELRHLHQIIENQSYLVSYWQRSYLGRRYLVVAWHDVPRLVHDSLPLLYHDLNRGNSLMNVVDEQGAIVFGPPIKGGEFTVGKTFPTTLYNWRLQIALKSAEALGQKVERQRLIELVMVSVAAFVVILGTAIVVVASVSERRVAALKSDFVANVSHELKTPLALVRMFGELLLSERVKTEDKRKQYLEIIVSESERLTALIENVLDFAKVERGKAEYDFAPGDVGAVVTRAAEIYRHRAEREGVSIALSVSEGLPQAMIDARALELSVLNLIDNALKYAQDGGSVKLSVERQGDQIAVSVSDLGPGIAASEQTQVFERFVRGKGARAGQVRGSGIGLALVKHIAVAHRGSVTVQSPITADGKGSSFVIRIPAMTASAPSAEVAVVPEPGRALGAEGAESG
jgi:two-component system, OmpR family, phosphate regulon sensor histidine kinase PhoR